MSCKYIGFDTETGGTNPEKNPILTMYMLALDEDLSPLDSLDLAIRPEAPFDVLEEEALAVNGIDMQKHLARPDLISRAEASQKIKDFVVKNTASKRKDARPQLLGHNVYFDKDMLNFQIMPRAEAELLFHYRIVDTLPVTNFLKLVGLMPKEVGNLTSIGKHFGFDVSGTHDAKVDVLLCIKVYKAMIELVKNLKDNAGVSSKSILELIEQ
jgi:DNA polymerase III epsilon subunit-like protein